MQFLKWSLASLLVATVLGAAALLHFGGVRGYIVRCEKAQQISCMLLQETSSGVESRQVPLGASATAEVQIKTYGRSRPRVLLYLQSAAQSAFAAEFEGGDEVANAQAAAAKLNRVFSSPGPASAQIEVRPAPYMGRMIWAGYGFFVLLVLAILRELFKPEHRPNNSSKPTPLRGAA